MKTICIDDINYNIVLKIDPFFTSKVANSFEIENLLLDISLPSFLYKAMPIIKNINNLIKCDSYTLHVEFSRIYFFSYMNFLLSANVKNDKILNIGHFFFNNYLNKNDSIYLDISIDLLNDQGVGFLPKLEQSPDDCLYDLKDFKEHIYNLFNKININDFFLEFNNQNIYKKQSNYNEIIKKFNNEKEKEYYNHLKTIFPIVKRVFGKDFKIVNIINDKSIFKMIEFSEVSRENCQKIQRTQLTQIFNNLTSSIEDSFIRAFIYEEFFNQTVIDTYLNEKNMKLYDMLELQNITDY